MSQSSPENKSQRQENLVKNTNVGRDLIFAPIQAEKYIETEIIQISVAKVTQRELIKTSPYQGLKRFNLSDRERFFGRDKLIARLFEAVNRSNLSLVLGASGSGKSSVVRAGLIPELKKSLENHTFYDFIFTPDEDPFDSLFVCLRNQEKGYSFSKSEAEIALKAEANTLPETISTLKKEDEKWLIFVDQFEQLFTSHILDKDKRNNFIEGLVRVANSGDNSVKIMLAMRADFLEQLSSYPALGAIANENNIHLVTDMHPDELRQAIEQPAAKHGVVFEEGLVEQIIKEVEGQKGYLPLLQYTLNLLWETECRTIAADGRFHIEDRTLNKTSYAALEGVRGALQKRVNEIYSNLNQDEQLATKQIFIKLVNIVDTESGSKTVSRRANRSEFVGESVNNTLQTFIDENLLVSSSENLSSEKLQVSESESLKQSAIVEIAHEILLSSWDRLKDWIEQEKEAIILKNWLAGETRRWQKIHSEDESKAREELLKGSRLEQVVEFRQKDAFQNIGGLRAEENQFIDVSVQEKARIEREKEEQGQRELEAARKFAAESEARRAAEQAKEILEESKKKEELLRQIYSLVTKAIYCLQTNPLRSLILSIIASDLSLSHSLDSSLEEVKMTLEKAFKASREKNKITFENEIRDVAISPDSNIIACACQGGVVKLLDKNGTLISEFKLDYSDFSSMAFSPNGELVAIASQDNICLYNLNGTPASKPFLFKKNINFLEAILIWIVSTNPIISVILILGVPVLVFMIVIIIAAFLSLLTGSDALDDYILSLVIVSLSILFYTFFRLRKLNNHGRITSIAFSSCGRYIASGTSKNQILLWSLKGKLVRLPFEGHKESVTSVTFSPNGKYIASGSHDSTVKLWDLKGKSVERISLAITTRKKLFEFISNGIRIPFIVMFLLASQIPLLTPIIKGVFALISVSIISIVSSILTLFGFCKLSLNSKSHFSFSQFGDYNFKSDFKRFYNDLYDKYAKPIFDFVNSSAEYVTDHDISVKEFASATQDARQEGSFTLTMTNQSLSKLSYPNSVAFSPDGKYLVSGNSDRTLKLRDVRGDLMQVFRGHTDIVTSVAFSPDCQYIISGSNDKSVRLWDTDGNLLQMFLGHDDSVISVSFSPDGEFIVSCSSDNSLRIWDAQDKLTDQGLRAYLRASCKRLKNHSRLRNLKDDEANQALIICQKYSSSLPH